MNLTNDKPFVKVLLGFAMGVVLAACARESRETGLVIVALEGLRASDISCSDIPQVERSGFSILCHEFSQVEGIVASSTSSVPSLAALLTGNSPDQLGVFSNNDVVRATQNTLAEYLYDAGWRTAFFVAGPPLTRRSGLTQGFDYSNETFSIRKPFRPLSESVDDFRAWLAEDSRLPFFALVTAQEILHPEFQTQTDRGEARARTTESLIEEIDESLFQLFNQIKTTKRWNNTHIVVLGLQGRKDPNNTLFRPLQVRPDQFLVPAFVKLRNAEAKDVRQISGTWTHAELGKILRDLVSDSEVKDKGVNWLIASLQLHENNLVQTTGCTPQFSGPPLCRSAFVDRTAWLPWDKKLNIDSNSRAELLRKVQNLPKDLVPDRFDRSWAKQRPEWLSSTLYHRCELEFPQHDLTVPYSSICASKLIQLLREIFSAKAGEGRELRTQFIRRWMDLAIAAKIYDWNRQQEIDVIPNSEPYSEFKSIQQILNRPELTELRKECENQSGLRLTL